MIALSIIAGLASAIYLGGRPRGEPGAIYVLCFVAFLLIVTFCR